MPVLVRTVLTTFPHRQLASYFGKGITSNLYNLSSRESPFQYDSILKTKPNQKWISVFRHRVRERFYESKVVNLISILAVPSRPSLSVSQNARPRESILYHTTARKNFPIWGRERFIF